MARIWDKYITEQDRKVYEKSGFGGKPSGFGSRPAIIIIDVQYRTAGIDAPILESIEKSYPTSCGASAWSAVRNIQGLLKIARERKVPIIYAVIERKDSFDAGRWKDKNPAFTQAFNQIGNDATRIVEEIAPQPGDIVVSKRYASAFFGTPLMTYLNDLDVDTVIFTGCATSGCVRATVADAFSYAFRVIVAEDCVYDRGEVTHAINLFDINAKYGDVVPSVTVKEYLSGLSVSMRKG